MSNRRQTLGKNLQALLSTAAFTDTEETIVVTDSALKMLPIEMITRSPYQPRREFAQVALQELALSIRTQGVIQPILVRQTSAGKYELIAGERRWRASQMAGLTEIPALLRNVSDEMAMALALIENIQRENLNPIEEAMGLQRLLDEFSMTHQQIADAIGKSRTAVTNLLRLQNLAPEVKKMLQQREIEMGHARALLALTAEQQLRAAREIIANSLSVRQTEKWIRKWQEQKVPVTAVQHAHSIDPDVAALQRRLSETLGATVLLKQQDGGKGQLVIAYNSFAELDGILEHIK